MFFSWYTIKSILYIIALLEPILKITYSSQTSAVSRKFTNPKPFFPDLTVCVSPGSPGLEGWNFDLGTPVRTGRYRMFLGLTQVGKIVDESGSSTTKMKIGMEKLGFFVSLFRWNLPIKSSGSELHIETSFFGVLCWDQNIESSLQLTRILRRSIWNFIPKWSAHVIVVWNFSVLIGLALQMPDLQPSQVLLQSKPELWMECVKIASTLTNGQATWVSESNICAKSNRRRPRQFKSVKIEMWRVNRPGNVTKVWGGLTRILQLWETRTIVWKAKGFQMRLPQGSVLLV